MTEDPRISEIRAVLDEIEAAPWLGWLEASTRIRAILDRPAPAPRVFFRGDTVPAGTYLLNRGGGVIMPPDEPWEVIGGTYVELPVMPPEEWKAAVARAHAEREEAGRG